MKPLIIICIVLFSSSQVNARISAIDEADSLLKVLQYSKPDINRVKILLELSKFYLHKTYSPQLEMDSALVLVKQAEALSQQLNYAKGQKESVFLRGKIYVRQEKANILLEMLTDLSDTNRIKLLVELGKSQLRPTYEKSANWDSAMVFFQHAQMVSDRIGHQKWKEENQCLMGATFILKGDWIRGKAYFTQVIEARRNAGDKHGEMKAWLRMATVRFCDECAENINALSRALKLAREVGDRANEALILLEMGYKYLLEDSGVTTQARNYALQALEIQNNIGFRAVSEAYHALADESVYHMPSDYGYLSNACYLLSDLGQISGDLNRKLFYVLEVVKSAENSGWQEDLDYAYYRLANAYWELGQYDKSMLYYQKSLEMSQKKGEAFIQIGLVRRMVVALLEQRKPTEALHLLQDATPNITSLTYEDKFSVAQSFGGCYDALEQYSLAEQYYLAGVVLSVNTPLQFQHYVWQVISQFFVSNGQYAKAAPYLDQLLLASPDKVIPSHLIDVHLMRFKVDSAQGDYKGAIKHYQLYKALSDSVFNEKKSSQIEQLSIQYETKKKEQELKLKEKDIELLTQLSKTQENQRNTLIGGTGLLIILLILLINRYRLKQSSNRHLQSQQLELQAQKEEIHQKNEHLSQLLAEKDFLINQQDTLIIEKDQLLTEKEWLLKEIHHRVKNNLQIVMSLLNSQVVYLNNEAAKKAIRESQHRVQAISLIHKKLYQSDSVAAIDMPTYINELIMYLRDLFNTGRRIRFKCQNDPVKLDVSHAVPLGLILNEAITNGIKYAFPENRTGVINISLKYLGNDQYNMNISDNGIGLPANFDVLPRKSLGMSLMEGLSSDIDGSFTIENKGGTTILVTFIYKQNTSKNGLFINSGIPAKV